MSANWVKRLDKNTVTVHDKNGNAMVYERGAYQQIVTVHQSSVKNSVIRPIQPRGK